MSYGTEQAVRAKTPIRGIAMRTFGTYDLGARVRYAVVARELRRMAEPARVLDVGCGQGLLCFAMRRRWQKATIVGTDIEPALIRHCNDVQNAHGDVAPIEFIDTQTLPRGGFSLVTCVDVLEHIEDDAGFARELCEATEPGGTLILHTPAEHKRRYFGEFEEQHDHVRDGYTAGGLASLLYDAGYSEIRVRYTFGPLAALAWEGFALARSSNLLARAALPFWYALSSLDALVSHRNGNGLIAIARRKR